jgi:hypothetical protein
MLCRALVAVVAFCILILRVGDPAFATGGPAARSISRPEVQLLVLALDSPGTANIALTYAHVTPEAKVIEDLAAISRYSGWQIQNPQITVNPESGADLPAMTNAEFTVANAVPASTGALPIEPLLTGLKRFHTMLLIFAMRPDFHFQGLQDFDNKFVSIRFRPNGQSFTYEAQIKDSSFDRLGLPTIVQIQQPQTQKKASGGIILPLIISVVVAAAVWLIAQTARTKKPDK